MSDRKRMRNPHPSDITAFRQPLPRALAPVQTGVRLQPGRRVKQGVLSAEKLPSAGSARKHYRSGEHCCAKPCSLQPSDGTRLQPEIRLQ